MAKDLPKKPAVRTKPRISVNKLAEYLTASPSRRRTIVKEQKYPPSFRIIWYEVATTAIVGFLCAKQKDEEQIVEVIERLSTQKAANESEQIKLKTNAEALGAFLDCYDSLDLGDGTVKAGSQNAPKLIVAGVELSVRPEVLLQANVRGNRSSGAVKLYLSKDSPLDSNTGPYVAAVVERYLVEHGDEAVSRKHCQVFDVFGQSVEAAPVSTKTRMKDIEAACEEIRLLWQVV